jgi:hypothetical protein
MDKELQLCSVDDDEMVPQQNISQQPQRRKGGLITMPFIIGPLSIYLSVCLSIMHHTIKLPSHPRSL